MRAALAPGGDANGVYCMDGHIGVPAGAAFAGNSSPAWRVIVLAGLAGRAGLEALRRDAPERTGPI